MEDILSRIYQFYPKGIAYDDSGYQTSKEYIKLCNTRNEYKGRNKELLVKLKNSLPNFSITDWTNLEENNCMQYEILTVENQDILDDDIELMDALGGTRIDVDLYISIIGHYYFYKITKTELKDDTWDFSSDVDYNDNLKMITRKIELLMDSISLMKVDSDLCMTIIPDIETELLNVGEVNVFNCLFTELETI